MNNNIYYTGAGIFFISCVLPIIALIVSSFSEYKRQKEARLAKEKEKFQETIKDAKLMLFDPGRHGVEGQIKAANLLGDIGGKEAIAYLIRALEETGSISSYSVNEELFIAILNAIMKIGGINAYFDIFLDIFNQKNNIKIKIMIMLKVLNTLDQSKITQGMRNEIILKLDKVLCGKIADAKLILLSVETLEKLGWSPNTSSSTAAAYWISKNKWKEVIDLGANSINPLISMLDDPRYCLQSTKALMDILKNDFRNYEDEIINRIDNQVINNIKYSNPRFEIEIFCEALGIINTEKAINALIGHYSGRYKRRWLVVIYTTDQLAKKKGDQKILNSMYQYLDGLISYPFDLFYDGDTEKEYDIDNAMSNLVLAIDSFGEDGRRLLVRIKEETITRAHVENIPLVVLFKKLCSKLSI